MAAFNGYRNCGCNTHSYYDCSPTFQHNCCNQCHLTFSSWLPLIILTLIAICSLSKCGLLIIMLGIVYLLCQRLLQLNF